MRPRAGLHVCVLLCVCVYACACVCACVCARVRISVAHVRAAVHVYVSPQVCLQHDHHSFLIRSWYGGVLGQQIQEAFTRPLVGAVAATTGIVLDKLRVSGGCKVYMMLVLSVGAVLPHQPNERAMHLTHCMQQPRRVCPCSCLASSSREASLGAYTLYACVCVSVCLCVYVCQGNRTGLYTLEKEQPLPESGPEADAAVRKVSSA